MSDANDNKIVIKLEIHVPVGAGNAPVVIQSPAPAPPVAHAPPQQAAPHVALPPPAHAAHAAAVVTPQINITPQSVTLPSGRAKVKVTGTNNRGVICVTKNSDTFPDIPMDVYLKVLPFGAPLPDTPGAGATPDGTRAVPDASSTFVNWKHAAVPDAICDAPSTGAPVCNNKLVVWRLYSGQTEWTPDVVFFRGECASVTDCEASTNVILAGAPGLVDTAPGSLQVVTRGFGGLFRALNGTWVLLRAPQDAVGGNVLWVSGGDGVHQPRAEVLGSCCGSAPLELRFSYGGKTLLYRAQGPLQPLGPSRFVACDPAGSMVGCEFPAELHVIPV